MSLAGGPVGLTVSVSGALSLISRSSRVMEYVVEYGLDEADGIKDKAELFGVNRTTERSIVKIDIVKALFFT